MYRNFLSKWIKTRRNCSTAAFRMLLVLALRMLPASLQQNPLQLIKINILSLFLSNSTQQLSHAPCSLGWAIYQFADWSFCLKNFLSTWEPALFWSLNNHYNSHHHNHYSNSQHCLDLHLGISTSIDCKLVIPNATASHFSRLSFPSVEIESFFKNGQHYADPQYHYQYGVHNEENCTKHHNYVLTQNSRTM